jgi:hypothetical protein
MYATPSFIEKVWRNQRTLEQQGINNRYLLDSLNTDAACDRKLNNRARQRQRVFDLPIKFHPRFDIIDDAILQFYSDLNARGKFSLYVSRLGKREYQDLTYAAFASQYLMYYSIIQNKSFDDTDFLTTFTYKYKTVRFIPGIFNLICASISSHLDEKVLPNGVRVHCYFNTDETFDVKTEAYKIAKLKKVYDTRVSNPIPFWDFNDARVFEVASECMDEFVTFQCPFAQDLDALDLAEIGCAFCVIDKDGKLLQLLVGDCDSVSLNSIGYAIAFGICATTNGRSSQNSDITFVQPKTSPKPGTVEVITREYLLSTNFFGLHESTAIDDEVFINPISRSILGYDSPNDEYLSNESVMYGGGGGQTTGGTGVPDTGGNPDISPSGESNDQSPKGRKGRRSSNVSKSLAAAATTGLAVTQAQQLKRSLNRNTANIETLAKSVSKLTKVINQPSLSAKVGPFQGTAKIPM